MMGFLIDSEEFEVKPAINRLFLISEFLSPKKYSTTTMSKSIDVKNATFTADGLTTVFSVGEMIGVLFFVSINGLVQQRGIDYYWLGQTSKVTFFTPPITGSQIMVSYYAGRSNVFQDAYGNLLFLEHEAFLYDGSSLTFTTLNPIHDVLYVEINGLVDQEGVGFAVTDTNKVTLLSTPQINSRIGISYLR
jgi:hypothetical protein